jgi:hypothetical protein
MALPANRRRGDACHDAHRIAFRGRFAMDAHVGDLLRLESDTHPRQETKAAAS